MHNNETTGYTYIHTTKVGDIYPNSKWMVYKSLTQEEC